jgi:hypothetical protein
VVCQSRLRGPELVIAQPSAGVRKSNPPDDPETEPMANSRDRQLAPALLVMYSVCAAAATQLVGDTMLTAPPDTPGRACAVHLTPAVVVV